MILNVTGRVIIYKRALKHVIFKKGYNMGANQNLDLIKIVLQASL